MILQLHLGILLITFLVILYTDFNALLWLLGKKEKLSEPLFKKLHIAVSLGLAGMIITGIIQLLPLREWLFTNQLFGLKMFFVGVLVINSFLVGRHMKLACNNSFNELSNIEKRTLAMSGLVSTASWIGAFVVAKILF